MTLPFIQLLAFIFVLDNPGAHVTPLKPTLHIVRIDGMRFVPKVIEIQAGDKVRWVNESDSFHRVETDDGIMKSKMLDKGESYEQVFSKSGEIKYYCKPHKIMGMKGVVRVK